MCRAIVVCDPFCFSCSCVLHSISPLQDEVNEETVEEVILGLVSQLGEREDSVLCSDVRNNLFGPMEFSRRDLAALNIMRGRDNGLPDYNTVRKCHGLPVAKDFTDINPELNRTDPVKFSKLAELYQSVDDIDL